MIPTLTKGFYICCLSTAQICFLLSNCSFLIDLNSISLSSFPHIVQSRSLQNIQASRVLHAPEPPFSTDDEAETLPRHPSDGDLDDIRARMEKLDVAQERSSFDSVSQNYSQEGKMDHFVIDPITGHIAALTWDPQRSTRLRPHADDMWRKEGSLNLAQVNCLNLSAAAVYTDREMRF